MTIIKIEEVIPDFMRRFDIIERLFEKHGLGRNSDMDYRDIEALDQERKYLSMRNGWSRMAVEDLEKERNKP